MATAAALATMAALPVTARAQRPAPAAKQDSVTIRLVNTELRAAVQLVAQYLDRPVLFSGPGGGMVTLETPRPVPRADVPRLLQSLLDSQNYELVNDTVGGVYRVRPKEVPRPPLQDPAQMNPGGAPRGAGNIELFVLPLKHARAVDVATTVNALYGKSVARTDGSRRVTLGDELRQNQIPPIGAPQPSYPMQQPQAAAAPTNTTITGGGFTGEVTIVPDARANNLLVRANRADYTLIENVVRQLDTRPLQVMIEVLIAEVRRDKSLSLGVDLELGETTVSKGAGTTATGSISGAGDSGLGDFAIKVMKIGGINLDATLRAVAGKNHVSIVSRPVVLTANNQEAEIVVGSQRPFVQVSRSLPTDQAIRDQVVQYKDVGTKLTVRPSISVDGSVELEVKQEVSSATTETAFNAPVISTRSVQTQLLIRDGQTVVLGGLTDKQKDVTTRGVPVLSSIPIIGGLFGRVSRQTTETELFIFLTPRVIRSDEDAARLSSPLEQRSLQRAP
ncbi:MAG TPA: secretin N-terminal domain-containing protein [Gemmatimonadaceae bacterium]|nr:secretin N-terminal domain-containing protein [Gemmatimonadaceae bacterium]